ncbi:MAG: type I polyketide synthase, partial [Thermoanaerobaculia bacterium]
MNDNENKLVETLKKASLKIRELVAENDSLKRQEPIAVIGLSCRFPGGGESPEEFWELLARGGDAVGEIPRTRWDVDRYYDADPDAPGRMYTRSGAFLDGVDTFDAPFFNITPREAEAMDPQQRVLLEMSWAALEDAALDTRKLRGSQTGVFLGLSNYDYIQAHIHSGDAERITPHAGSGVMFSTAAGRLSYVYDFRGPCLTIDTACSSSLVALHLAMESLQRRESDLALAAGVNLLLSLDSYIALCKVKALAADGRSRAFSDDASGYGRGEGCAVLVLKRLSDAQRDGDRIVAVLRGAAVNHDGRSNGLTAPNGLAQQAVIRKALANAGIDAAAVDYVETHGTGTILGDPIEFNALSSVFGHPLRIGSVKTNIGHTEAAAGIAGVVKVILAMQHDALPPSIHFGPPNRHIDWNASPIRVVQKLEAWPASDRPRIAGISSFGLSGTNAHVVIEEAPRVETIAREADRPRHLLPLSAATGEVLDAVMTRCASVLEQDVDLGDVCHTAASRSQLDVRIAVTAATCEEMREKLAKANVHRRKSDVAAKRGVAFLFTGQGSQYARMGAELFATEPVFRQTIERCDALLDLPIVDLLYKRDDADLTQTAVTQPLLFSLQVALTELWKSWGVQPTAVAGHSIGEYAAAYAAGVFTLEAAAKLTAERGRLMQSSERGAMAVVFADEETVRRAIAGRGVVIAGVNAPECITISGSEANVANVLESLGAIRSQRLAVSHAFHSPSMQPILRELERAALAASPQPASLHFYSTSTGDLALRDVATPSYWAQQLVRPVRFVDALNAMARDGHDLFLEAGPSDTLSAFVRRTLDPATHLAVSSLRKGAGDVATMLDAAGTLFVHGQNLDWQALDAPYPRRRLPLPTYPFQRKRYWLDLAPARKDSAMNPQPTPENAADDIVSILSDITGLAPDAIDRRQNLMEMGLDSLMLLAMGQKVEKQYGVTLQISQFFQELSTIEDLARYIEQHGKAAAPIVAPVEPPPPMPAIVPSNLFEQQLHYFTLLCQQQL